LVIVEDVPEGEDEEEDATARSGRSKFRCWEEDPGASSSEDEFVSSATR
jgi:hypothetical protein